LKTDTQLVGIPK